MTVLNKTKPKQQHPPPTNAIVVLYIIFFSLSWFHLLLHWNLRTSLNCPVLYRVFYLNFSQMSEGEKWGFLCTLQNEVEEFANSGLISALKTCVFEFPSILKFYWLS